MMPCDQDEPKDAETTSKYGKLPYSLEDLRMRGNLRRRHGAHVRNSTRRWVPRRTTGHRAHIEYILNQRVKRMLKENKELKEGLQGGGCTSQWQVHTLSM